jgi:hypothetical protein
MERIFHWALPILLFSSLATSALAQAGQAQQNVKWTDNKEYEDYRTIYGEKDLVTKAGLAEKFLVDHKNADPLALTQVYTVMLLSYANASNWAKVVETYDRINIAPKLTDADKQRFAQIAEIAKRNLK